MKLIFLWLLVLSTPLFSAQDKSIIEAGDDFFAYLEIAANNPSALPPALSSIGKERVKKNYIEIDRVIAALEKNIELTKRNVNWISEDLKQLDELAQEHHEVEKKLNDYIDKSLARLKQNQENFEKNKKTQLILSTVDVGTTESRNLASTDAMTKLMSESNDGSLQRWKKQVEERMTQAQKMKEKVQQNVKEMESKRAGMRQEIERWKNQQEGFKRRIENLKSMKSLLQWAMSVTYNRD